jgi:hypothetical protein
MIQMKIDPLKDFGSAPREHVIEACGVLPNWVAEWYVMRATAQRIGEDFDVTLKDHLDQRYGFGLYEFTGSTVDEDGTYHADNDEDPPLKPLITIDMDDLGKFHQYQYAICAIPVDGGYFVTRMD